MRQSEISRKTKETDILLNLNIDGQGQAELETGIGFFDHMLDLFAVHGLFDLQVKVKGDLEVDAHHTVEDVALCLGDAFLNARGDAAGIKRYASMVLPMDDALVQVALDVSNRPYFSLTGLPLVGRCGLFDAELCHEFFRSFANQARLNLHIKLLAGDNLHHCIEAMFKALARCLREALDRDSRQKGVPSSKGVL